uniref:Sigma-54-dependent Fis family transcriptional regulator n=1 Tax=Desulfacinum infernum TaxID=35837 RepID=A0A832A013_9BACT
MYELVWKGSRFHLVRSRSFPPPEDRGAKASLSAKGSVRPPDAAAWRDYVMRGRSEAAVQEIIRQSWSRCLQEGVDPAREKCWDIRYEEELGDEFRMLKALTRDVQTEIYRLIHNKGLLVTVSDRRGYLVGMLGDLKALRAADRLNFGPGANWAENSVGTNAIGTALRCGHVLQVRGTEHFCESHHSWICSAAPIFDWDGNLMGCFDISGPMDADHRGALDLAAQGARIIESRLYRERAGLEAAAASSLVHTVFKTACAGLIYVDRHGRIADISPMASALLGTPREQVLGAPVDRIFHVRSVDRFFKELEAQSTQGGLRVSCLTGKDVESVAFPVTSPNGTFQGVLLHLDRGFSRQRRVAAAPPSEDPFRRLLGMSDPLREAVARARRVASTDTTVLLVGESGTGKEVLARAIHEAGRRSHGPFVAVNCGAIPSGLIQSVLFGYVEGAFTGARRGGSPGKFEQAHGGTLFLDEVAEMPLDMQVNLLRVLEEGCVTRVGGTRPIEVDVRIIAATHRDLAQRVHDGRFREDLYYRLNVVRITLPSLRDRGDDIWLLSRSFIEAMAKKLDRPVRHVAPSFYRAVAAYSWPGNVRELRHAIEAAMTLMPGDVLEAESLPDHVRGPQSGGSEEAVAVGSRDGDFDLRKTEAETIRRAYAHFRGNITETARALGIGRNTLYAKLRKIGILSQG